jgi:polyisoprenoid-binding protein YceI
MRILAIFVALALASCAQPAATLADEAGVVHDAPAGEYRLDPSHADLSFRVNHIGMSMYTARFTDFDATLQFDPQNPGAMRVEATIDVGSLALPSPPEGFAEQMLGPQWFDAAQFPQMTFRSTAVERTGANTARVTGDLTLHGITKPVTLAARFNGGYAGHPADPHGRIGFSAHGVLQRSDFAIAYGIPPEGSTMGVFDEVEFVIEAEFNGPPLAQLPTSP